MRSVEEYPPEMGANAEQGEMRVKRTIFTEEHLLFRDAFRHFVEKEMVPYNEGWEKDGEVSRELWLKAGQQGFLGMSVPEEYGGAGVDDFRYSGGYGYMLEYPIARMYLDARVQSIYAGTNEIMKEIIGRSMGV